MIQLPETSNIHQPHDNGSDQRGSIDRINALITKGDFKFAERGARAAVNYLTRRDDHGLLVNTLILHAITLSRLGNYSHARSQLDRAIEISRANGDVLGERDASLTIIQELFGQTPINEIVALFTSALLLSFNAQNDISSIQPLIDSFSSIMGAFETTVSQTSPSTPSAWEGFSLKRELLNHEAQIIRQALRDSGGSVTIAARLIGFRHHQSLISILNTRHKELQTARSAVRKRRHHLLASSKSKAAKKDKGGN